MCFESRALSLEQETDSFKLALAIIRRKVEKSYPRSANAKHSQKIMPANVIQPRNRFEPLQDEEQNQRNARNREGNSDVQGQRTSSSSSETRLRNTGSVNLSNQHNHLQPNRHTQVAEPKDVVSMANYQQLIPSVAACHDYF